MRVTLATFAISLAGSLLAGPWGVVRGPGIPDRALDGRDASGAAVLSDADLPAGSTDVVFSNSVSIGCIALSSRELRFSAAKEGVVLSTTCAANAFLLRDGSWTFDGLGFSGPGVLPEKAHYYGGAIDCCGGALTVTNCSFSGLAARFNGGAVSARLMTGDVRFSDCAFKGNVCGPKNGTGGAVYASGVLDGPTVALRLLGCVFSGNAAQNGGAVMTVHNTTDDEAQSGLEVAGCTFDGNVVDYNGGAVFAGGDVTVSNSQFVANGAGVQGGALCVGGPASVEGVTVRVEPGTVFRGNMATNDAVWTCGGAIALVSDGGRQDIVGRYVVFEDNAARSPAGAFGGAIFTGRGAAAVVDCARFLNNHADVGGGAVFSWGDRLTVDTSVFSNNVVSADSGIGGYGGAISVEDSALVVSNTTVRYSNFGAVDVYDAAAEIANCVIVDNGEASDIRVDGNASLSISYSAFGTLEADGDAQDRVTASDCLPGMDASVYRGGSLYLNRSGTNPAVVKGLPQSNEDHVKVQYGYDGRGYAMGAFECPTPSYRIIYDLNDKEGEVDNRAVNNPANRYGFFADELPVTIYPPMRPCYEFVGWEELQHGVRTRQYRPDELPVIPIGATNAYTFVARWTPKEKPYFTITYRFEQEDPPAVNSPLNPCQYAATDTPIRLQPPTKPGYLPVEWRMKENGKDEVRLEDGVIPSGTVGDLVLDVVWQPAWTIAYDLAGGAYSPETPANPVAYCEKTLPLAVETDPFAPSGSGKVYAPVREGYEFTGWQWKTDAGGSWQPFTEASPIPAGTTGDLTLKATWSPIQNTIEYDLDGGVNDPSNPTGYTVETEFPIVLKPATREDLSFGGWLIRDFGKGEWVPLEGGVLPPETTGYVWVKAVWTDKPTISLESLTWYHCRSEGHYYPRIVLKVVSGSARDVTGVVFSCEDKSFDLPAAKLRELQALPEGGTLTVGVENFKQYPNSPEGSGFVPPDERLPTEGFADRGRPPISDVTFEVQGMYRTVEGDHPLVNPVKMVSVARRSLRQMPSVIPVAAQFSEFRVGEVLSGKTEVPADAKVRLLGCAALGDDWVVVGELAIDADGCFTTVVPEGLRFFKLEAEVER